MGNFRDWSQKHEIIHFDEGVRLFIVSRDYYDGRPSNAWEANAQYLCPARKSWVTMRIKQAKTRYEVINQVYTESPLWIHTARRSIERTKDRMHRESVMMARFND